MKQLIISLLILSSCSQINTESRDYYQETQIARAQIMNNDRFRHGLVPIPHSERTVRIDRKKISQASIARGKVLYQQHCLSCHGQNADGKGTKAKELNYRPKDLVAIIKKVPNFKLYMMVSQWKGEMPGWKSMLNEKETEDLRNYLLNLAK